METIPQTKLKLDYKKTFLIGFGFLASSALWSVYNSYVPLILNEQLGNVDFVVQRGILGVLVGFIMTFDNIFGVIFQPMFGKLSDRTHSRFGKRRIYLLIGMPISALLFVLIPMAETIVTLMLSVILFNFVMSTWRSPVVALMPDLTPPALRSEGNAVINLMGGVGTFLGMVSGMALTTVFKVEDQFLGRIIVFAFTSIVTVICLLVVMTKVKEPDNRLSAVANKRMAEEEAEAVARAKAAEKKKFKQLRLSGPKKRSLFFMLIGLFFIFNGSETLQTYFTTFATTELGVSEFMATLLMGIFALSLMIFAVPAGKLGQKIGRKKTILIGLAGALVLFLLIVATRSMGDTIMWIVILIALIGAGACVALININTLPIVLEIGTEEQIGAFTGYYYTATFTASIFAPIAMGAIFDVTTKPGGMGYWSLPIYCAVAFLLAFLCILFVRHGEAENPDAPAPDAEVA